MHSNVHTMEYPKRRTLLGLAGMLSAALFSSRAFANPSANKIVPIVKTKDFWKSTLPQASYLVLFEEATERAGTSALNSEKRKGTYICAACRLPLFKSEHKFDSGTGWPSFFDSLSGVFGTKKGYKAIWPRTEYHCIRCGGHQGHVFDDCPKPTRLRYCNNGVALAFVPEGTKLPELLS